MKHSLDEACGTCYGLASLGERGQVVIPKTVRERLGLAKGDNFLVMERMGMVVLAPASMVEEFVGGITQELKKIKK